MIVVEVGSFDSYKKTYPLLIDGTFYRHLHISIFGKNPSFSASSEGELQEALLKKEKKGARAFLLRRLAMKNYHTVELKAALKKRFVSSETVEFSIEEFHNLGYLNDEAWVASFIRIHRQQKLGLNAITMKLRMKGVADEEVQAALEVLRENEDEVCERTIIAKLIATRYRNRDLSDRKEKQKVVASLARKGFSLDDIFAALNFKQ